MNASTTMKRLGTEPTCDNAEINLDKYVIQYLDPMDAHSFVYINRDGGEVFFARN